MEFLSPGLKSSVGNVDLKFLPSQVSGLKLWCRYNSGITVTGAGVSQWDDVSGNDNHLKQGTDTNRPSKESDGSILFDGNDNYLKADAFTLVQPETVFILFKSITWTDNDRIFDGNVNLNALYQNGVTPNLDIHAGIAVAGVSTLALDTYGILSVIFNGASSSIQHDNNTPVTGDAGPNDMGGIILGAAPALAEFSNIQVKEIFIFDSVISTTVKLQLINYLATVGGLSV